MFLLSQDRLRIMQLESLYVRPTEDDDGNCHGESSIICFNTNEQPVLAGTYNSIERARQEVENIANALRNQDCLYAVGKE